MTENIQDAAPSSLPRLPDVTGWLLTEAQAVLQESGCTLALRLIETGPPPRKPRPEYSDSRKAHKPARAPIAFGDWRVLRWRVIEAESTLELLIAREQRATANIAA